MKQKILEALKQGHKNLGLSEEAFERVAAFGETFITSEDQIANFVKGAEVILKSEQSEADKARAKAADEKKALEAKVAELEAKLKGAKPESEPENKPEPKAEPKGNEDLLKQMEALFDAKMKPLNDKIAKMEGTQAYKEAVASASERFNGNDWVKKYKDEADDAWERVTEYNELKGNTMTADEMYDKAMGYFGKAVKRKGDDISQPFKAEGSGESEPDFSPFDRAVAKQKEAQGVPSESASAK